MVWIDRVAELPGAPVQTPPGWFDLPAPPQAPIVNTNPGGIVVPVGGCISVVSTAWVGDCPDRQIQCIDLRAAVGWQPGTQEPVFIPSLPLYTIHMMLPTPICYPDPDPSMEAKKRASWKQLFKTNLIRGACVPTSVPPFDTQYCLPKMCFDSANLLLNCPDSNHACQSGKYTPLLDVTDKKGFHYYDTQQVWFDNKPIQIEFDGLQGVAPCQDVCLSKYAPPGAPCNTCWPMNLNGIAFDELIEPLNSSYPSNNFLGLSRSVTTLAPMFRSLNAREAVMTGVAFWTKFVLAVLATWRVTHLLASVDGPADLMARFRARLGRGLAGKLMDCFNCLSFWIAAPAALFASRKALDWLFTWLAVSDTMDSEAQREAVCKDQKGYTEVEVFTWELRRRRPIESSQVTCARSPGLYRGRAEFGARMPRDIVRGPNLCSSTPNCLRCFRPTTQLTTPCVPC